MHAKNSLNSGISIIKNRLFGTRYPLSVSYTITNRCNKRCTYCKVWDTKEKELTTEEAIRMIDEMAGMGCQRMGITGGEPLLRKDIGEVIEHSKEKGIFTGLVTNGSLVPKRIDEIDGLDLLQVSLDGPEEIHDMHRGEGSYKEAIKAIEIAKEKGLEVWVTTVLTKHSIDGIDFVLDKAEEMGFTAYFQPVLDHELCGGEKVRGFYPEKKRYNRAIQKLIDEKDKKKIGNSLAGLRYLLSWPENRPQKCWAGKLYAHIYPNGNVHACFNMVDRPVNCREMGFKKAFEKIGPVECNGCYAYANIEFNLLCSLNPEAVSNTVKLLREH